MPESTLRVIYYEQMDILKILKGLFYRVIKKSMAPAQKGPSVWNDICREVVIMLIYSVWAPIHFQGLWGRDVHSKV